MKDKNTSTQQKQESLARFLDDDEFVLVHLNPKNKDLIVPEYLTKDPSVTLKLSRYFRGKLNVETKYVEADLVFSGQYFSCIIPYDAIWGCTSEKGENLIWPESTPEEVLKSILESAVPLSSVATSTDTAKETHNAISLEKTKAKPKTQASGRPMLRRVK